MIKLFLLQLPSSNSDSFHNSTLFSLSISIAPKGDVSKSPKPLDMVKTGSILDVQGFLNHLNNSEEAKKVIKAFRDCGIPRFLSFGYQSVNKEEVLEFYLKARLAEGRKIISSVAGRDVEITADVIRAAYELPPTTEVEVHNHASMKMIYGQLSKTYRMLQLMCLQKLKRKIYSHLFMKVF